jgi:hypothetical protein
MAAESSAHSELKIARVLFIDIVGYSKLLSDNRDFACLDAVPSPTLPRSERMAVKDDGHNPIARRSAILRRSCGRKPVA